MNSSAPIPFRRSAETDDRLFHARLQERRDQYSLRDETKDLLRTELANYATNRDIDRFIDVLGPISANTRDLVHLLDRSKEDMKTTLQELGDLERRTRQLLAILRQGKSLAIDEAVALLDPSVIPALEAMHQEVSIRLNDEKDWHSPKQNGRDVHADAMFVAIVVRVWSERLQGVEVKPHGVFCRVIEGIVRLEHLPFRITKTVIQRGLSLSETPMI